MPSTAPVDLSRLRAALPADCAFRAFSWLPETGSTNADLVQAARAGAPDGTLVGTEYQSAGRGRFQRHWEQTPGSCIAMSVLWRTDAPGPRWGWLPLVAGLGVRAGIARYLAGAATPVLKWPNDILVDDGPRPGKLVGILAERVQTPTGPAAVIGVGINVALDEAELPVPTATSLLLSGDPAPDKTRLLTEVLTAWSGYHRRWTAGEDLSAEYERDCGSVGRTVRVQLDEQRGLGPSIVGVATGVDAAGSLLVRTPDGLEHALSAGDVVHLRR